MQGLVNYAAQGAGLVESVDKLAGGVENVVSHFIHPSRGNKKRKLPNQVRKTVRANRHSLKEAKTGAPSLGLNALARVPHMKLFWDKRSPFPPILHTTLATTHQFTLDNVAGTNPLTIQRVFTNIPDRPFGKLPQPYGGPTSTTKMRYFTHFAKIGYTKCVVYASRLRVSMTIDGTTQPFTGYLRLHDNVEFRGNSISDIWYTDVGGNISTPSGTSDNTLQVNCADNPYNENMGSVMERKGFIENLVWKNCQSQEAGGQGITMYGTWSLDGHEGVTLDQVIYDQASDGNTARTWHVNINNQGVVTGLNANQPFWELFYGYPDAATTGDEAVILCNAEIEYDMAFYDFHVTEADENSSLTA